MTQVRIVLDTSAIVDYANGSVHVGEVLREVADDGGSFALPMICLAKAGSTLPLGRLPMLDVLVKLEQCSGVNYGGDWQELSRVARGVGNIGRGAALLLAISRGAYVLTAEPDEYGDEQDSVIAV